MMRTLFGLTDFPFLHDSKDLYLSEDLKYLQDRYAHALETQGIILLTGEIGSGKTTFTRHVLGQLNHNSYRVIYLPSIPRSSRGFFRQLVCELGLTPLYYVEDLIQQAKQYFLELFNKQRLQPVVVIDEAQNLSDTILEDIRLLTNFQMDSRSILPIFLLGHPVLKARLKLSAYAAFRRRIAFSYHLSGLKLPETQEYIDHRLKSAGRATSLFSEDAVQLIFNYSRGLPGLINPLAHEALFRAARQQQPHIEKDLIELLIRERDWM
ncbi:MAG: AAA family ATPase [Nitrospinae bacterium]|nr:AAA family ATPase [Nitrospinota bacterium]